LPRFFFICCHASCIRRAPLFCCSVSCQWSSERRCLL
jgi:hypothetical protein